MSLESFVTSRTGREGLSQLGGMIKVLYIVALLN